MPVIINGTTGISGVDGSAATPAIEGGDTNTGMFFPAADTIAFAEGGVESMRIDPNGRLGIGTTTPAWPLDVNGHVQATRSRILNTDANIDFMNTSSLRTGYIRFLSDSAATFVVEQPRPIIFYTDNTERVRITAVGDLLFNSGYGSAATAYGCRAWVNFQGSGTVTIRASGNVSSITDNSAGNYTVNMTTSMPDINYSAVATCSADGALAAISTIVFSNGATYVAPTVSAFRINARQSGSAASDPTTITAAVFR